MMVAKLQELQEATLATHKERTEAVVALLMKNQEAMLVTQEARWLSGWASLLSKSVEMWSTSVCYVTHCVNLAYKGVYNSKGSQLT